MLRQGNKKTAVGYSDHSFQYEGNPVNIN
jgi:hypothetical protein